MALVFFAALRAESDQAAIQQREDAEMIAVLQAENGVLREKHDYLAGQSLLEHKEMASLRAQVEVRLHLLKLTGVQRKCFFVGCKQH